MRGRRARQEETPREKVRAGKDYAHQRLAWAIGATLILVLVGILGAGYYQKFYHPPRVWAGSVRDVEFTMGDLVERIRVLQGLSGSVDLSVIPFEYLQELLNAEILRQAAPGLGINVTDEDIDEALRNQFYPEVPEGQETDPGQLDREFENNIEIYLARTGLSREEYRQTLEEQLQLRLLFGFLGFGIEDTQEQVEVEWIRTELTSELDMREVRERLNSEEFAAVADEVGMPAGFAGVGGYVGWVPRGAFPNMDETLFGDEESDVEPLSVGDIADPVFLNEGIYIIHKVSGPETRDLSDNMRNKLNSELLIEWRNNQLRRGSNEGWLKMNFDSTLYAWVADQVAVSAPRNQPEQR
ncbi:MAG: hypothetical protein CL696_11035 [Chloroflexi bacterium]|nr:hypothetical protein [Chloroflexota bacterium]